MDSPQHKNLVGFIDLLFNMLVGITFLFILAFILINPNRDNNKIDPKAEYLVILDWPDHHNSDVDLWVMDPMDNKIGFTSREKGVTSLERDDLGSQTDTHKDRNGRLVYNPVNREVITIRGIVSGEWTVNVHYYNSRPIPDGHISGYHTPSHLHPKQIPVPIEVKVIKLNPTLQTLIEKRIILTREGEERTMARFTLDENGEVLRIIESPKEFVLNNRKFSGR